MDIGKLEYFFAAAELQNFTQAADRCNVAQTTMSKHIALLETEVGVPLFHRTNKGCYLTDQGKLFYAGMKKLYSEYNEIMSQVLADEKAVLRIGIVGAFFKLSSLQAFENAYRNMTLYLSFGTRAKLFEDLRRQHIHAVILPNVLITDDIRDDDFITINLLSEEGLLTYSSVTQDRFATIGEMLETLPFITKSSDREYHDFCREVLYKHYGARFRDVLTVNSASRQQLLVSLSQGFAIIAASEIAAGMDLRQRSVGDEFIESLMLVYNRRHVPAYLKEFIRFCKSHQTT